MTIVWRIITIITVKVHTANISGNCVLCVVHVMSCCRVRRQRCWWITRYWSCRSLTASMSRNLVTGNRTWDSENRLVTSVSLFHTAAVSCLFTQIAYMFYRCFFVFFFVFFLLFPSAKKYETTVLGNGWTDFHETFTKRYRGKCSLQRGAAAWRMPCRRLANGERWWCV